MDFYWYFSVHYPEDRISMFKLPVLIKKIKNKIKFVKEKIKITFNKLYSIIHHTNKY